MKFVGFNQKVPGMGSYAGVMDDLRKECEIKVCEVGKGMVFTTSETVTFTSSDTATFTSTVVSVDESFTHILVETENSFYTFEK